MHARLFANGDEYIQSFEDDADYWHYVCDHNNGICLDEITEPAEHINYVSDFDGIVIDSDDSDQALIQFWNSGH